MDEHCRRNSNDLILKCVRISFWGSHGEDEATHLWETIRHRLQLAIERPRSIPERTARLGGAELVILIILAPIFQYGITMLLDTIRDFLQKRKGRIFKGQIIIKLDARDPGVRFPFETEGTKWDELFRVIGEDTKKVRGESLQKLIERKVEKNNEIKSILEIERAFLQVGILLPEVITKIEQNLTATIYFLEQFYNHIRLEVEANNGRVLISKSTEVLACFTLPCDAICCALAILEKKTSFGSQETALGNPPDFKIGINSGCVVFKVGDREGFNWQVLEHTALLQRDADKGTLLISEETYRKLEKKGHFHKHKSTNQDGLRSYVYSTKIESQNKVRKEADSVTHNKMT